VVIREQIETVIIGGGQAGLAVGYHLAMGGRRFVILEANPRVGDSWRKRWDSLRVFTPAKYDGLPGMRFSAPSFSFPTKDAMGDYQATYAARFNLPVRTSTRVDALDRVGDGYCVTAGATAFSADNVVVATGASQAPKVPGFASGLAPAVNHMHSSQYTGPAQLCEGDVLVVGIGNSGAEIAFELSATRKVWLAGSTHGEIPFRHDGFWARMTWPLIMFVGTHVLTVDTPIGRKAQPRFRRNGVPLFRVKSQDLSAAGVERVSRVLGVRDGRPLLADGRILDVPNVIWCTGFRPDFDWVHLPVFGDDHRPLLHRGVVQSMAGLYFVGLEFQFAATSGTLRGIVRDAEYVARRIVDRESERATIHGSVAGKPPATG
jgi:putative flavoprotein involved in K+ transport